MKMNYSQLINNLVSEGVLKTPALVEAFREIDRADFVPSGERKYAYLDTALPIGYDQTISQPYTVAFMLELLNPQKGEKILDVGSGSGWTTALLACIVGGKGLVMGVEVVPELVALGQNNLAKYEFPHARIEQSSAKLGCPEHAPYDKILVSAAGNEVPQELTEQLKIGGVMVLPVGDALWKVTCVSKNKTKTETFEGFAFVPLIR
ncbi:protein-L-isoaspartate O-methyltransferase [Candidatus Kaiserbacteria bacterium]|nr:protein-L-isoaspartate O-methyltransferase [Candidatus Kaiserbacteria bacterium]